MPKQGTFAFLFGWCLDALGAFSVMVTVSFLRTDMDKILDKLSRLPLTEGQSTIAREFCPDVVQAVRDIRQNNDEAADVLDHAQTKQLQAVLQFAQNCQRRAAYEQQLRQEKGMSSPHFPVDVPKGGVPPDFPIPSDATLLLSRGNDDDSNTIMSENGRPPQEGDFDFYDPRQEKGGDGSSDWADGFTTDRENDGRK